VPILKYLADTNTISDYFRNIPAVREWMSKHDGQIGISTLTLAEIRRGIELRKEGKMRRNLERSFKFILEDYRDAIFVFDEAAAHEWGKLMAESREHLPPYDDSLIAAIARSCGLAVVTRNYRDFQGCDTVDPWTGTERRASRRN
jgi:predicted nucleic acid-binding protein